MIYEQDEKLRREFESNKKLFPSHPMDEGDIYKRKRFNRNEKGEYTWSDIRRDWTVFKEARKSVDDLRT
jgi:hypothetical protein